MKISILRSFHSKDETSYRQKPLQENLQEYEIPFSECRGDTVLSALLYIRQHLDPSLAFRYGCRFHRCGICTLYINSKARLACKEELQDKQEVAPLPGLPVIKDLVINRKVLLPVYKHYHLYIPEGKEEILPKISVPPLYYQLTRCTECLACLASCPRFQNGETDFWGPWLLVKLALLHLDPRDDQDRILQAANLNLSRCADCKGCSCLKGIPIRQACKVLLANTF